MPSLGEIWVKVGARTAEFERKMASVTKRMSSVGEKMSTAGRTLSVGLTAPLVGLGYAAERATLSLNEGMANVSTLIPGSARRVADLRKEVVRLSVATATPIDDLTDGLYQVISAFGDSADTVAILDANARAAKAGVATTTDAINLTSAVTKAYGDATAAAVRHVSDLSFMTVKLGQTRFPELSQSIGRVAPLAASLGVKMSELFGVMATGTGVTGNAAEVSTQFRGILQALAAPTSAMSDLFEQLGYANGEAMLKSLGLQGTINKIAQSAAASGTPLQNYIGSIEGQTLAVTLAGAQAETFTRKLAAMGAAAGTTDEAFREQTQGVNATGFAFEQAKRKVDAIFVSLGEGLAPALVKAVDAARPLIAALTRAAAWFAALDPATQTWIVSIAALSAAMGPLLFAVGSLAGGVGKLIPLVMMLGKALMFLAANPVGLTIVAVGALVAAGVELYRNWDVVVAKAREVWHWLNEQVNVVTVLVPPLGGLIRLVSLVADNWDRLVGILRSVKGAVDDVVGWFGDMYDKVVGHSYVPDMIRGIAYNFGRLDEVMVRPVRDMTGQVRDSFHDLGISMETDFDRFQTVFRKTRRLAGAFPELGRIPGFGRAMDIANRASAIIDVFGKESINAALAAIPGIGPILSALGGGRIASKIGGGLKKIFGFQYGGIVTAPTLAMIGENPKTRPEVVAPLSELRTMMGGGDGTLVVQLVSDGRELARTVVPHFTAELRRRGIS